MPPFLEQEREWPTNVGEYPIRAIPERVLIHPSPDNLIVINTSNMTVSSFHNRQKNRKEDFTSDVKITHSRVPKTRHCTPYDAIAQP